MRWLVLGKLLPCASASSLIMTSFKLQHQSICPCTFRKCFLRCKENAVPANHNSRGFIYAGFPAEHWERNLPLVPAVCIPHNHSLVIAGKSQVLVELSCIFHFRDCKWLLCVRSFTTSNASSLWESFLGLAWMKPFFLWDWLAEWENLSVNLG